MSQSKFTPGPWGWFGNAASNTLYLATVRHGRRYVMKFCRWGMAGAQPVFQPGDRMVDAKDLLRFEVGDLDVVGIDAAKANGSVYRYDVRGIAAPDACLIAAAPCLYEALEAMLRAHPVSDRVEKTDAAIKAHAALKRARGES